MKKLTRQNSELIQKWTDLMAADLENQEAQMVDRLNEQRVAHQDEVTSLHETIAALKENLTAIHSEFEDLNAQNASQLKKIEQMNQTNQTLEENIVQLRSKLSESYKKVLEEKSKNLAFSEKLKNVGFTDTSMANPETLEAIEKSQRLQSLVEEERKIFEQAMKDLNQRIEKLENEKQTAIQLIEEVKKVSTVEELSERLRNYQRYLSVG